MTPLEIFLSIFSCIMMTECVFLHQEIRTLRRLLAKGTYTRMFSDDD